jgi:hypothetical protein
MPLAVSVGLVVTLVTVVIGIVGYLIDRSAERHERKGER